jgi:hypothetical protein
MTQKYDRLSTVSVADVLEKISAATKEKATFAGQRVVVNSKRLNVFKNYGLKCSVCGIEGMFFAVEKNDDTPLYHLNLWARDTDGTEVLMTQYKNKVTMCLPCNRKQYVIDRKGIKNA